MRRGMLIPIVTVTVIVMRYSFQKVQSSKKRILHTSDQTGMSVEPGIKVEIEIEESWTKGE